MTVSSVVSPSGSQDTSSKSLPSAPVEHASGGKGISSATASVSTIGHKRDVVPIISSLLGGLVLLVVGAALTICIFRRKMTQRKICLSEEASNLAPSAVLGPYSGPRGETQVVDPSAEAHRLKTEDVGLEAVVKREGVDDVTHMIAEGIESNRSLDGDQDFELQDRSELVELREEVVRLRNLVNTQAPPLYWDSDSASQTQSLPAYESL